VAQAECGAFDAVTVPVLVYRQGPILHANPAMLRLLGRSLAELTQLNLEQVALEDDQPRLLAYAQDCLAHADEPPALELTLLSGQQARRVVEVNGRRVHLAQGPVVVLTCQDLSDIQHVQHSMLYLSQLLNQIINSGPVATLVIDNAHRVTQWNRACEHLTGWNASDMRGSDEPWRAFYPAARPLLADLIVDGADVNVLAAHYPNGIWPSATVAGAWEAEAFSPVLGPTDVGFFSPLRPCATCKAS
jgi:two-component system NtrC family sensor kinase